MYVKEVVSEYRESRLCLTSPEQVSKQSVQQLHTPEKHYSYLKLIISEQISQQSLQNQPGIQAAVSFLLLS